MQRRVLVLALSALMVWGMVAPAMANSNPFYDVPKDHWAYDSVSILAEAGLIEGYPDGSFGGSRLFTRYEMAMVFARVLARFEAHIDAKIEEGIHVRTEDLALQVNEAMETALEALALAIQAQSEAEEAKAVADAALERAADVAREVLGQSGVPAGELDLETVADLAAEIAASIAADIAAGIAADVAANIAADVAVDAARVVAEETAARVAAEIAAEAAAEVAARVAAEVASKHLAEAVFEIEAVLSAMEQAVAESQDVAQAALKAVADAQAQIEALARAAAEAAVDDHAAGSAEAKELAAQALRGSELARVVARNASQTAKEAKELAAEARRIAETRSEEASILARLARLEATRAQNAVQQAISLAENALAAAEAGAADALRVAQEALELASSADAEIDELFALLEQVGVDIAELQDRPAFTLTDEAEAAIGEIAAQLYAQRLADLEARADEIAAEVVALAGRAISAEEAAGIAQRVVALELRKVQGNIDSIEKALRATQGDVKAIELLLDEKANALGAEIDALAKEFRDELALLGVRVADLEDRMLVTEERIDVMDEDIREIRAELDRVRVSGVNETTLVRGHAPDFAKEDPRDPESDPFDVPDRATWSNLLQLRMDAIPADGVTARLGFDLLLDRGFFVEQDKSAREVLAGSKVFAELTTEGEVEYARLGYLEKDVVASGYNRFLVTEKGLENAGDYGGYAELTFGDAHHALFLLQSFDTGRYTTGVSSYFDVSDATDLTLNFVREWNGMNSRTGVSGSLVGSHEDVRYRGLVVADLEEGDMVVDARFSAPFAGGAFVASYERIPEVWGDADRRLPFSDEKLAEQADWSLLQTRADIPVMGFTVWGQYGVENTELSNGLFERFTRVGLYDLTMSGIDVDLMHERIVNQSNQWTYHNHLVFSTSLEDWNVSAILHDRTLPADQEKHQMLRIGGPIEFIVPFEARAQFATSRTASPNKHMEYALEVADYRIFPNVSVAAQYVSTTNAFDENDTQTWLDNAAWTDEDRVERSIGAAWEVTDRLTLSAGFGAVDSSVTGRETSHEAGIKYELDIFSGDLSLGYGYKVVRDGAGNIDGTPRNTFFAQFVRAVGGWTLNADGKYVLGGASGEAGNDRDLVGQLKLNYPIYSGADFTLDGKFVSSKGLKAPEYEAHRITAGLRVTF